MYLWSLASTGSSTGSAELRLFASAYTGQFSSRIDAAHFATALAGGDADAIADEAKEQARLGGVCSDSCTWDDVLTWASPGRIKSLQPALRQFFRIVIGPDAGGKTAADQAMSA